MASNNPKLFAQETNLMLGGDKWEPESTFHHDFPWRDPGAAAAESGANAAELAKDYYSAHFELGADPTEYVSSTTATYKDPKSKRPLKMGPEQRALLSEAHFMLGGAPRDMRTTAEIDFAKKRVDHSEARTTAAKLKKDLQSSHFELGADAVNYESEAKANFTGAAEDPRVKQEEARNVKVQTTLLRADNQDLPTHTFYGTTSGKMPDPRDTPGAYTGSAAERAASMKEMRKTNVLLGEDHNDYRTQYMVQTGEMVHKTKHRDRIRIKGYTPPEDEEAKSS